MTRSIISECKNYYFDPQAAWRAVQFFENEIIHLKGELGGQKLKLEDWQVEVVSEAFGWFHVDTKLRRYRTVWIEVPRKNGKSFLASGFGLYLTFADGEPGAEVVCASADKETTAHIFAPAKYSVENNKKLRKMSTLYKNAILVNSSSSYLKVITSDARTKHGYNLHGLVVDEVHMQQSRDLIDTLHTATGARRQPMEIYLTTAGSDRKTICWEMHDYALKVRDGIINDPTFLPVIYAADEDDDWHDPETWKKANPNYGISIKEEYLEAEYRKAVEVASYENTFKRLHLNIWTEQDSRWFPMEKWESCVSEFSEKDLEGLQCYAGLDLSSTTDVTALVLVFPNEDFSNFHILPYFWVPEENIYLRQRRDRVPYVDWVRDEYLFATPGARIDYARVRKHINELHERFNIREIAIDRWNASQLVDQLEGDGFEVVGFGQGYGSMSAPSKEFEAALYSKQLLHNDHPVLTWMASNIALEENAAGDIKPSKKVSHERIDGIVSLIMALGRAGLHKPEEVSVYEERGFIEI